MSQPGAFDAYVMDEQEKAAQKRYEEYVEFCFQTIQLPVSFEEWADNEAQNKRTEL